MSVTPSPIGGFAAQFFDNNGVILSGGKIYTYAAGTTTPQATYTSAAGVTPHTNPIVLDSAGRVPGGEIWLTDGLIYKFVIETSTAILIGTYDNITGVNSNFVNYTVQEEVITATAGQTVFNLSTINYTPGTNSLSVYIDGVNQYVGDSYLETDSNTVTFTAGLHVGAEVKFTTAVQITTGAMDASAVGYTANFTGASGQTVQTKLEQYVSVKDFGAVGDGVTDDTVAIQAAATNSGAIYFPEGSYLINAAISVPSNTYLYAENATVTQSTAAGTHAFTIAGDNVTIDGLTIVGPNSGGGSAVFALNRNNPVVKNCKVQNWLYGIQLRGCKNWVVQDNRIWGGTYDSVAASDIFIYGASGTTSNRGIVTGNFCLSNTDVGISVDTNSGDKETVISNNVVYPLQSDGVTPLADANNRRRYGIAVGYNGTVASRAVISGNVVRDVPYSGIYMNAAAIPAGDVSITGNNVSRCGFGTLYPADSSLRAGIWCNGGADTITGNVVTDCSFAGIKVAPDYVYSSTNQPRAVISSNNVSRTAGPGIWLTNRPHGYLVTGNRIVNSTGAGIQYESTTADGGNCHFVGNHIDTNTTNQGGIIAANSLGGYDCSVTGNKINGIDNTTNAAFNAGIWFDGVVHCSNNTITKYYTGINCGTAINARTVNLKCSGNTISDCAFGIGAPGTGPWLITDNTFKNITTLECSGSAWQGAFYRASGVAGFGGGAIYVADTAAPTAGTWAVGDHCAKTNPAIGQPKGWFCTVAGTPGTWTSEGNL